MSSCVTVDSKKMSSSVIVVDVEVSSAFAMTHLKEMRVTASYGRQGPGVHIAQQTEYLKWVSRSSTMICPYRVARAVFSICKDSVLETRKKGAPLHEWATTNTKISQNR